MPCIAVHVLCDDIAVEKVLISSEKRGARLFEIRLVFSTVFLVRYLALIRNPHNPLLHLCSSLGIWRAGFSPGEKKKVILNHFNLKSFQTLF